jgi:hypothetical protein
MAIQVTCPGCRTRFKVGDQHAGKQGACPKCKTPIRIPKPEEEVVVHAPEHSELGAKDAKGRHVLKPIAFEETKFSPLWFAAIAGVAIIVIVIAVFLRGSEIGLPVLATGAILLGPPLAYGGYTFLRDAELEPHKGKSLILRSIICGVVYACLWGLYAYLRWRLWGEAGTNDLQTWQVLAMAVLILPLGSLAAYASFDLEPLSSLFHYSLYLLVTILLRMTLGLPVI